MNHAWPQRPALKRARVLAVSASVSLHVLGWLWFRGLQRLPELDLELVKPSAVEFGITEDVDSAPPPSAAAAPTDTDTTPPAQPTNERAAATKTAPKAAPKAPKPLPANPFPEAGNVGRLAPQGSQLALRLDLERIAEGPLANEAGALLSALPDVRSLLQGSGVDPVHDLARLFIASPDLRREHVVLAGRYRGAETLPRNAVQQLAEARGAPARWRTQSGIRIAPWLNDDPQARVLALVGPKLFTITRAEDLARVLNVARALQMQRKTSGEASEALVHMAERELMNVSVEGARAFVRGARAAQVPERFVASIRARPTLGDGLEVDVRAHYPDEPQAEAALQFWDRLRAQYANHAIVALLGMSSLLQDAKLSRSADQLTLELTVSERQARVLLRWGSDAVRGPTHASAGRTP
jgi:hypothetical protein